MCILFDLWFLLPNSCVLQLYASSIVGASCGGLDVSEAWKLLVLGFCLGVCTFICLGVCTFHVMVVVLLMSWWYFYMSWWLYFHMPWWLCLFTCHDIISFVCGKGKSFHIAWWFFFSCHGGSCFSWLCCSWFLLQSFWLNLQAAPFHIHALWNEGLRDEFS